jgi:NAD(P)-dependent dehydrogenase (short-subunit alcohol dehydrogenase family)
MTALEGSAQMTPSRSTPDEPARLDGRTAVVTGGTDGIGLHIAAGLAGLGATVIVTGRDLFRGARAADEIRAGAGHDRVEFVQVDHLTVGANQRFAEHLEGSVDWLDILVNNVGRVFPARQETQDGFEATLALCLLGPYALTEAALPLLTRRPGTQIVNMSSSAYKMWHHAPFEDVESERDYVGIQAHAHVKLLNLIWTFALAERLRERQVAVNATNPGAAWTPGTAQLTPQAVPAWRYVWPIVRFFQQRSPPAKAAQSPLWLITSSEASGLTGSYVEKRKIKHPKVATSGDYQRRVMDLAEDLVAKAATAVMRPSPQPNAQTHRVEGPANGEPA